MAPALNLCSSSRVSSLLLPPALFSSPSSSSSLRDFESLSRRVRRRGRVSCLFSNNRKQEQAKKSLENALGGKKSEFEKWDKELKKKEELARGSGSGGGKGWFGWWGGRDDRFWGEVQRTSLTVLAILVMYFVIVKGDVLFATICNPLLSALRGVRNSISFVAADVMKRVSPATYARLRSAQKEQALTTSRFSAKENVLKKWGST